jgi:hypothetical protein
LHYQKHVLVPTGTLTEGTFNPKFIGTDWRTAFVQFTSVDLGGSQSVTLALEGSWDFDPTNPGAQATVTTAMTGANNDITITAREAGLGGNEISLTLTDPSGNDQTQKVTVTANYAINVLLATSGAGAITSTAQQVVDPINAHPLASKLVSAIVKVGDSGATAVTALSQTFLASGTTGGNWSAVAYVTTAADDVLTAALVLDTATADIEKVFLVRPYPYLRVVSSSLTASSFGVDVFIDNSR